MQKKEYSLELDGKTLTATFSDLADQATGSVMVKYGETVVLVTAVMSDQDKAGGDFFPLTVDYEEKFYAAGRILGGRFIRREGRPSDEAVLSGRIVDRTIRPLFDWRLRREVQVVVTVLSIDDDNEPDVPAVIGASLALATSKIPWNGPVSAVRLGQMPGSEEIIINPSYATREGRLTDILVCGQEASFNMIEAEAKEISEEKVVEFLTRASAEIEKIQAFQRKIVSEIGVAKEKIEIAEPSAELKNFFESNYKQKLFVEAFDSSGRKKTEELKRVWLEEVAEKYPSEIGVADWFFEQMTDELVHREIIENNRRPDGRQLDEIRPLFAQAGGISKIVHGTGIFYRGGTHVITTLTLGGPKDSQIIEGMEVRTKKYFMHHYNFPPFSTGEVGRLTSLNRRSIGHGALAEKALRAILPSREIFPYTIRLVSESTASNGSTSMASVCASALALMDGGVPISRPAAGVAMGLMSESTKSEARNPKYKILTDIQGPEDFFGDMDFKVAGTEGGVSAIQLDVKIQGLSLDVLKEALAQAREGRLKIIETIRETIALPRPEIAASAPKIIIHKIEPSQIGMLIGTGGKTINGIIETTGADIDIEEDGKVFISGRNGTADKALEMVKELFREYHPGEVFEGLVTRLMDFGAFVKIGPNAEGLVHISEIAPFRIEKVGDALAEGEKVPVVVKEIDERGRINLSIKDTNPEFASAKGVKPSSGGYNRDHGRSHPKTHHPRHQDFQTRPGLRH